MLSPRASRLLKLSTTTLVFVAFAARAHASSFEITPLAGYRVGGAFRDTSLGADRDIQEQASFGLALDLGRTPDTQWELSFSRQNTSIGSSSSAPALDLRIDYLQLGGTYFWSETKRGGVEPYVVGGLGITRFSPLRAGLSDRTQPALNVGVGLRIPLSKRFALRFEGRGYVTLLETSGSIFCRSDSVDAACTIHARASGLWQIEALFGLAFRM